MARDKIRDLLAGSAIVIVSATVTVPAAASTDANADIVKRVQRASTLQFARVVPDTNELPFSWTHYSPPWKNR